MTFRQIDKFEKNNPDIAFNVLYLHQEKEGKNKSKIRMSFSYIKIYKYESIWAKIGQTKIWKSKKQKHLGVIIDQNLKFDEYVLSICRKASKKLNALTRICHYLNLQQRRTIMKSFAES